MSYRVDIPTLSANEVYTLTFEYEGTETIQLIVGDLTLETTDRRVVFTTTSPVNYIESNVNLTNLNMYEGYYESDDFGGEYTQESYIEGKSLINLINVTDSDFPKQTSWYDFTINKNISDDKYYTLIVDVSDTSGGFDYGVINNQGTSFTYLSDTITTDGKYIVYRTFAGASQIIRFRGKTSGSPITINSLMLLEGDYSDGNVGHFTGIGCVKSPTIKSLSPENLYVSPLKYREPLRGYEYYHNDGTVEIYPNGSGAYSTIDLYTGEDVGMTYLGNHKDWYVKNGIKLGLGAGTYYFCCEIELVANKQITDFSDRPQVDVIFDDGDYFSVNGSFTETYDGEKYYYKGIFGASNKTVTDDIRGVYVGIWSYGNSAVEKYVIRNITLTREPSLKDICAISKSSIITTPDDLELYGGYDGGGNWYGDKLDLTTGTFYQYYDMWDLATLLSQNGPLTGFGYNSDTNTVYVQYAIGSTHPSGTVWGGQGGYSALIGNYFEYGHGNAAYEKKTSPYIAFFNKYLYLSGMSYDEIFNGVTIVNDNTLNWNEAVSALTQFATDNNLKIGLPLNTPTTEQLSLNALKSYRNGSIQTSSQQLTPTLKTTLPISNKFTTTNLTSGSTYNVYFDGTATKLDAGGTIITNPISPCEVECGGTTLTIEGTDIQNVRVIETTVKNEVGSVNGTTDAELKKMKTCKYENILDDIKYSTTVSNGAVININYDDFCIEFMGAHGWAGEFADTGLKYPTGCSLVHVEFDIDMDNPNLRMAINFNEGIYNNYPQHRHVTLNNDTATIAQGNYDGIYTSIITKGHFSRLMYANGDRPIIINLYTGGYITGILATENSAEGSIDGYETIGSNYGRITNLKMRIIENFSSNYTTVTSVLRDSSYNIIWQDMDMTIPQTISKLEQPIKLRSLGTTYDSYNPVTGELTKRIGVSETDGSYSVLSSPVVSRVRAGNADLVNISASKSVDFTVEVPIGDTSDLQPSTTYTLIYDVISNDENTTIMTNILQTGMAMAGGAYIPSSVGHHELTVTTPSTISGNFNYWTQPGNKRVVMDNIMLIQGSYANENLEYFEGSQRVHALPQLYTNGQVKVYSDSEVYPTTILNGQSTNNYEINELKTSNNYTIRYEGECESINLANKSNTQGHNVLVKPGATSGNLTFVNDNGNIDNVLLVQNDVREQEINHFTGLQTVEVSRMLIENQRNMWSQDYIIDTTLTANYKRISKDYIKVVPNETLYCSTGQAWMDYSDIIQYNENKERVTSTQIFGWGTSGMYQDENNIYKNKVQLSENTHYIRICMHQGLLTTASVSRGDFLPPSTLAYNQYQGQYIDLPQPVQLNSLPDGTCDTYNPITGEYVQNVGYFVLDDTFASSWLVSTLNGHHYAQRQVSTQEPNYLTLTRDYGFPSNLYDYQAGTKAIANIPIAYSMLNTGDKYPTPSLFGDTWFGNYHLRIALPFMVTEKDQWNYSHTQVNDWLRENPIHIVYKRTEPITTQLTPINIPTFEGGVLQLITTDGKVFPMIEYSMPTNNRYDTSMWEAGVVYTQRNMTEAYFNESTTPMTPTETMTLTTDHISSGSIILNDNGNGLIVLKGNYTGRDIPYFTGMRSVEAIEVETTPSPDQPLFGKGGRK